MVLVAELGTTASSRRGPSDEQLLIALAVEHNERQGAVFSGGGNNAGRLLDVADELDGIRPLAERIELRGADAHLDPVRALTQPLPRTLKPYQNYTAAPPLIPTRRTWSTRW